jgi:hypothetical protein
MVPGYVQGGTRPAGEHLEVGGTGWMNSGFLCPELLQAQEVLQYLTSVFR